MDDFASRAYNKQCEKEYAACMKQVEKGIVLDGEATNNKGACQYPTNEGRKLEVDGEGSDRLIEEY